MYANSPASAGVPAPYRLAKSECKCALMLIAESLDDQGALLVLRDYELERGANPFPLSSGRWPVRVIIDQLLNYRTPGRRAYAECVRLATGYARDVWRRRIDDSGEAGWVVSDEGRLSRDRRERRGLALVGYPAAPPDIETGERWEDAVRRPGHCRRLVWAGLSGADVPDDVQEGLAGLKQAMQQAIRSEAGWVG